MTAFQIRRRSDGRTLGHGNVKPGDTQVSVQGLGMVVSREALDELADSPDHDLVWPDGPPGP